MNTAEKLTTIAENTARVYEAGKRAQYDAFWDAFQQNGTRTDYQNAFANAWSKETFCPKYSMVPKTLYRAFANSHIRDDLGALLKRANIQIDFAAARYSVGQMFYATEFTALPEIDVSGSTKTDYLGSNLFAFNSYLERIEKIILADDGTTEINSSWFLSLPVLKEIRFGGQIARTVSFGQCPKLTKDSLESIVSVLSDTTENLTLTFSGKAVKSAFETADGAGDGDTSEAWQALIDTKPNWNFVLA